VADAPKPIRYREEKCLNLVGLRKEAGGASGDALWMFIGATQWSSRGYDERNASVLKIGRRVGYDRSRIEPVAL